MSSAADQLRGSEREVAGQLPHLLFGERHADRELMTLREFDADGHDRLVLRFVAGVVAGSALAAGEHDLVGYQLLFVEAVAQALNCCSMKSDDSQVR